MTAKKKPRLVGRITSTSTTVPKIDPAAVAQALGAQPTSVKSPTGLAPLTLQEIRRELAARLQSTGGRPALSGATRRTKIPLSDSQWQELEAIAAEVSESGQATSPGQVASVIISLTLRRFDRSDSRRTAGSATETNA